MQLRKFFDQKIGLSKRAYLYCRRVSSNQGNVHDQEPQDTQCESQIEDYKKARKLHQH